MFLRLDEGRLRAVAYSLPPLVFFACEQGTAPPGSHNDAPVPTLTPSNSGPLGPEPEVFVPLEPSGAANVYVTGEHLYFDYPNEDVIRRVRFEDGAVEDISKLTYWILYRDILLLRWWDAATGKTRLEEIDTKTLSKRSFELDGYYQSMTADDDAYYALGIGCASPARVDRRTGDISVQPFAAITDGGAAYPRVTETHLYCANSFSMIRLRRDFAEPVEYVYRDKARVEEFTQNEKQIVLLQRQQVFGDFVGSYPPHSFQVFDKDMMEDNLVVERWAVIERSANTGAFIFDPSTRCYYYTHASPGYGSVQYYCEDGRNEMLVGVRETNGGLAIDAEHVYWAERSDVMRLPKPVMPD